MGEAGVELLLTSQRIINERLHIIGFECQDVTVEHAIARMLGRRG
jgi:NAD dependent epimerase/dehydratase family enzyme